MAPLRDYGHWLDRNLKPQTYLYGSNYGDAVCGCSSNGTCRFSVREASCNCDASPVAPEWLSDGGFITNATALPIRGFSYGYLPSSGGGTVKAKVKFGELLCRGEVSFGSPGSSCAALK